MPIVWGIKTAKQTVSDMRWLRGMLEKQTKGNLSPSTIIHTPMELAVLIHRGCYRMEDIVWMDESRKNEIINLVERLKGETHA